VDSLAAAERVARDYVRRQPKSARAWGELAGVLYARERYDEGLEAHRTAMSISAVDVYDRVFPAIGRVRAGDYEEADRHTRELMRVGTPVDVREARWVLGISLRYQGRWREALELAREEFRSLSQVDRAGDAGRTHQTLVATILLEWGRPREAAVVFDSLVRHVSTTITPGPRRARTLSFQYALLASALSAAGDTTRLAIAADSAAVSSAQSTSHRDARLAEHVRGLLLASRGDTAGAIAALERAIYSPTTGLTRTNRELGLLYVRQRRPRDAVRVLGAALRSPTLENRSVYVTRTELHELIARAFDDLGMADSAAVHYRHVVRAFERSDPEAKPRYDAASRRLAALGAKR
jgi:tetratricopeptide (TPR) repeat protein